MSILMYFDLKNGMRFWNALIHFSALSQRSW